MKRHLTASEVEATVGSGGVGHSLTHVISAMTVGSQLLWVGQTILEPGVETKPSALEGKESVHITLEGFGLEIVEGEEIHTEAGSFVFISKGAMHQVINRGDVPLKLITIATPPFSI